jgi:hypothetical protein
MPARRHARSWQWLFAAWPLAAACAASSSSAPAPSPRPLTVPSIPPPSTPVPAASAAASQPQSSASAAPGDSLPPLPPAPPRTEVTGSAAVVWHGTPPFSITACSPKPCKDVVPDFHSSWIEPGPSGPKVVAQRYDVVFVGTTELWILATRPVRLRECVCGANGCNGRQTVTFDEPLLQSLESKRQIEPWKDRYELWGDDGHSVSFGLDGAVGGVMFASVTAASHNCGAGIVMHNGGPDSHRVDTGASQPIQTPPQIEAALWAGMPAECQGRGKMEYMPDGYDANGELQGSYGLPFEAADQFSTCPNIRRASSWIPRELVAWGKVPSWVASFLANSKARWAFMIPADRVDKARAAFQGSRGP